MKKKKKYDKVKSVKRMSRNVVGQPKPTTRMKSKKDERRMEDEREYGIPS